MRFGDVSVADAEGAILAHSLKQGALRLKKGRVLAAADIAALQAAGVDAVIAAVLDEGDVPEDIAAGRLASAMALSGISAAPAATGRANLHAAHNGLFRADRALVDRLNAIDPAITFACLADHTQVEKGAMVATIKIIPLAVPGAALDAAMKAVAAPGLIAVKPFLPRRTALIATRLPSLKESVMDKTAALLADRLAPSGSHLTGEARVEHRAETVAEALKARAGNNDLVVLFGASAVVDADDVIPAAIRLAGGTVEQVGMPVDPGNLLVLGRIGDVPVIGAPGCARSPKENGFDWVLARVLAGEEPTRREISGMGVGGLLMEIPSRPQPREARAAKRGSEATVEVVLLAAGRASRMGEAAGHKLLARFDGEPLVRRLAREALASKAAAVHVVTGYRGGDIAGALAGMPVDRVDNPAFASGMASSLAAGIAAVSPAAAGALILLGDMPGLGHEALDRLIATFRDTGGRAIVRGSHDGKRGNPVILPRAAFAAARALSGDVGARPIVESGDFEVVDIDIGEAAHLDVDTPEAVLAAGGLLER